MSLVAGVGLALEAGPVNEIDRVLHTTEQTQQLEEYSNIAPVECSRRELQIIKVCEERKFKSHLKFPKTQNIYNRKTFSLSGKLTHRF